MPITVEQHTNQTQGQEHSVPCLTCTGETTHRVLVSIDVQGEESGKDIYFGWAAHNQIIQCLGCKTVSFRKVSSNSDDYHPIDNDGNYERRVDEALYPSRVAGIKGLGDDVHYLPTNVRRIYIETLIAISVQAPVLAGIGLRALLETVCKEKKAKGKDLLRKIESLVSAAVLTPASAAILHKIRALGNAAAHEAKPHGDKQLGLAFEIVQHLLKDVYIFPRQVESEFG